METKFSNYLKTVLKLIVKELLTKCVMITKLIFKKKSYLILKQKMNLYNTLLEELIKTIQYIIIRCSLMGKKKNHKQKGKYV